MSFTLGFQRNFKMPHYNSDRPWTNEEWVIYLHTGRIHCAILGYEEWHRREYQAFQISLRIFDHEEEHLRRPDNLFPLTTKEWDDRRALLRRLHDDFTEFTNRVRVQTAQIQQAVANQHNGANQNQNQDPDDDVIVLN